MKAHNPEKLETASDYLEFIIHMAEVEMNSLNGWTDATFERNVHIDSILIRLRCLIEFLTAKTTSYDTDVLARHYIPDFALPEVDRAWLRDKKRLVDTTLAHLTIRPMPKLISEVKFPYTDMYRKVMQGLQVFFEANPLHVLYQTKEAFHRAYALMETLS
jgi:hypothetical protein